MTRWPTEEFHRVADPGPPQQDHRGPPIQFRDALVGQSGGSDPAHGSDDPRPDPTALGAFYRRLAARLDKPQAITATARKLAILVYRALKGELVYRDPGAAAYDRQQASRVLRRLRQRAAALGFELVNRGTGEVLAAGVS